MSEDRSVPSTSFADASASLPPVHKWTSDDCCKWLQNLQLEQYSATFQDKQIDGLTLLGIDNEKDIELTMLVRSKDHQRELLQHLNYLRDPDMESPSSKAHKVALEPLANPPAANLEPLVMKQELEIKNLQDQLQELRAQVKEKRRGSNIVAPAPGPAGYNVQHGVALKEDMSFDVETGKPLNQLAFTFTDEEKKQRPRFDPTTGEPVNRAAEVMLQQQLIKHTIDTLTIDDFDEENYVQTSLLCIERDNSVRHFCLRLMHWKWFDKFILFCIACNALIMGLADYSHYDFQNDEFIDMGWRNKLSIVSEPVFTAIFTVECVVKVIAMGFFMGRNTYLREPWNVLDFIVVVTAVLEAMPGTPRLSALRTFRVLRPLRSIARFPELNTLVKAILNSVPQLLNVFAILLAMLSIFAILAVQVFGGDGRMFGRCRLTPFPVKFKPGFEPTGGVTLEWLNDGGHAALARAYWEGTAEPCKMVDGKVAKNNDEDWTKGSSPWSTAEEGCAWPIHVEDSYLCNLDRYDGDGISGRSCPYVFRDWLADKLPANAMDDVSTTRVKVQAYSTAAYYNPPRNFTHGVTYEFEGAWKTWCGSDYDNKGNGRYTDERVVRSGIYVEDTNWGFTSMEHVPTAVLALFQCATLEGWTDVMYQIGDSVDMTFSIVFFVMLVLMGGMFVLNLILAVIEQSFGDSHEGARKDRLLARFIEVFHKLDDDGSGYLTIQELMTTEEFGHMSFGELNQIVKDYDQNFDGKISQEEFVELMMAVSEGELELHIDDKNPVEEEPNSIMCITFTSEWCFHNSAYMYRVVTNPWFERLIILLILVNTLVLSLYKWPQDPNEVELLDTVGFVLTLAFAIEMAFKLTGLGIFQYLNDSFNILDGLIVITSLIELAVAPPSFLTSTSVEDETDAVGAFSALRTVRLFRIFKLMSAMQGLRSLVRVCLNMLSSAVNLGALVMLFMYIFSILGMQLFANKFHFSPETGYGVPTPKERGGAAELKWSTAEMPRSNFDDFINAFLTVFQILTGEDWNVVMYTARRAAGDAAAIIYFTIVLLLGNFVLLNLFLAILLGGMESDEDEEDDEEAEGIGHLSSAGMPVQMEAGNASELFAKNSKAAVAHGSLEGELAGGKQKAAVVPVPEKPQEKAQEKAQEEEEENPYDEVTTVSVKEIPEGVSLWLMTKDNPFRKFCAAIVFSDTFDNIIIVLIGLSSLLLAIDNPLWDPESSEKKAIDIIDRVFTYLFLIECILKVIVLGFVGHKNAYLRISWNQLDFFVVVLSVVSMIAEGNESLSSLRSLRSLRALRPLRVISRYPGLKQVVNACFASIPGVCNASIITGIAFLMFAIIAVSYFKGQFYACSGDGFDALAAGCVPTLTGVTDAAKCELHDFVVTPSRPFPGALTSAANAHFGLGAGGFQIAAWNGMPAKPTSKAACEWLGLEWGEISSWNYNNVGNALLLLFEVCTTEGWVDVMYTSIDAVGVDMQPIQDYNRPACLFYIVFLITCSFFLMNLFVGVIIDNFNDIKKQNSHSVLLSPAQQQWVNAQKMLVTDNAIVHLMKKPKNKVFAFCWNLSSPEGQNTHKLDKFIMGCIMVNTLLMALKHFSQPDELADFMVNINYVFALIYTVEAVVKILGLTFSEYWRDNWNKFDFILVAITDLGLVIFWSTGINIAVLATVCRTFRVGRILRLVRGASGARAMFNTLVLALPALINISSLLLLLFFIYAVMGVQLFAKVKMDGEMALDEHANFQTFGMAMLTLLRCATGEFWNGLMYDLAISEGCRSDIQYDPNMCGFNDSPTCVPLDGCGSKVSYPFFVTFTLIITFVTIELFTAVIMDGFEDSSEQEKVNRAGKLGMTMAQYHEYCRVWLKYDPTLSWVIKLDTLKELLDELPAPVGNGEEQQSDDESKPTDEAKEVDEAVKHYTFTVDTPIVSCGIKFAPSVDGAGVVVVSSSVIGVDDGDVLLAVKTRADEVAKDVTGADAQATLHSLTTMKVPIEITLLRKQKTWIEVLKSYGLRPHERGGDDYEFHDVAKVLSKKVIAQQTGDDPRKVMQDLEKTNKQQLQAEEQKQLQKWRDMKVKVGNTKKDAAAVQPLPAKKQKKEKQKKEKK